MFEYAGIRGRRGVGAKPDAISPGRKGLPTAPWCELDRWRLVTRRVGRNEYNVLL